MMMTMVVMMMMMAVMMTMRVAIVRMKRMRMMTRMNLNLKLADLAVSRLAVPHPCIWVAPAVRMLRRQGETAPSAACQPTPHHLHLNLKGE